MIEENPPCRFTASNTSKLSKDSINASASRKLLFPDALRPTRIVSGSSVTSQKAMLL